MRLNRFLPFAIGMLSAASLGSAACTLANEPPQYDTATASPASGSTTTSGPTIQLQDFMLMPMDTTVHSGDSITVRNSGKTPHNLWVRDSAGKILLKSKDLAPGQSDTLVVSIPAGSYIAYCQEPGHESLGMKGTLTVT